jgi:hypothetical protein
VRAGLALALALPLAGCGMTSSAAPFAGDTRAWDLSFDAGPFSIAPGEDTTVCTFVRSTDDAADAVELHAELGEGVHHLAVYAVDHPVDAETGPCPEAGQPGWRALSVSFGPTDDVTFPHGVGVHLDANQQLVLQTHLLDTTPAPLGGVKASISIAYAGLAGVSEQASVYRIGTYAFEAKPGSTTTAGASCVLPDDATLTRVVGLQGRHGKALRAGLLAKGDGAARPVYETTDWSAPTVLDPFPAGLPVARGDALEVSCTLADDGATPLAYPEEVCLAVGYFHPAKGPLACAPAGPGGACACAYAGVEAGPGGASVALAVGRAATIEGAAGDLSAGWPLRCALYRAEDWAGTGPKPGASARYRAETVNALPDAKATASFAIADVTPGDYRALCFLDTLGAGLTPAKGEPVASEPPGVTVAKGATASVTVRLDAASP